MADSDISALCRIRGLPVPAAGRLTVNAQESRLEVVSFDGSVFLDQKNAIVADLENAKVATLMDNVPSGGGTAFAYENVVSSDAVTPNIVLVGADPWPDGALVRWAIFGFKHSDVALLNRQAIEKGRETDSEKPDARSISVVSVDYNKLHLFDVAVQGVSIRAFMGASESFGALGGTIELEPLIEVDFTEGVSVHEYLVTVITIIRCFALSIGHASKPSLLQIHYESSEVQRARIAEQKFRGVFDTFYRWPDSDTAEARLWVGHSVLQVLNDEERA